MPSVGSSPTSSAAPQQRPGDPTRDPAGAGPVPLRRRLKKHGVQLLARVLPPIYAAYLRFVERTSHVDVRALTALLDGRAPGDHIAFALLHQDVLALPWFFRGRGVTALAQKTDAGDIITACGIKPPVTTANPKFDYDKDELTPEDRVVLDQIATCLTTGALKGRTVDLIGRADPRGTEEYNLGLGSRRAGSVSSYLGRLGVAKPQMAVTTRGAIDATGTDDAGYAQDRRVDIQLQPQG